MAPLWPTRDGKTGWSIIVYGVLTDAEGRPVAVQVYPGARVTPPPSPSGRQLASQQFGPFPGRSWR